MKAIIRNNSGDIEIDPHNSKGAHEKWLKSISMEDGSFNLYSLKRISPNSSELLTRYILDMHSGKNLAKGAKKGRRSYQHLFNSESLYQ